jgi:hypothetical protein
MIILGGAIKSTSRSNMVICVPCLLFPVLTWWNSPWNPHWAERVTNDGTGAKHNGMNFLDAISNEKSGQ